jgi:hypothetical protein
MHNRWHTFGLSIYDDHVKVTLDQRVLFNTYDWTRRKDGRVALWTQETTSRDLNSLR